MIRVKPRTKIYKDILDFPVKTKSGEIVFYSKDFFPFEETTPGTLGYEVKGTVDDSTITLQVSYDKGETWLDVEEVSGTKAKALEVAPRVRAKVVLASASIVEEGEGVEVNLTFQEALDLTRAEALLEAVNFGKTEKNTTILGKTLSLKKNNVQNIAVIHSADASKMTNVSWVLQSSFDGENWWDATTADNISTLDFKETIVNSKLGYYFRVKVIIGDTGLKANHNLKFNMIALYY